MKCLNCENELVAYVPKRKSEDTGKKIIYYGSICWACLNKDCWKSWPENQKGWTKLENVNYTEIRKEYEREIIKQQKSKTSWDEKGWQKVPSTGQNKSKNEPVHS
jgi:hypothetical protein